MNLVFIKFNPNPIEIFHKGQGFCWTMFYINVNDQRAICRERNWIFDARRTAVSKINLSSLHSSAVFMGVAGTFKQVQVAVVAVLSRALKFRRVSRRQRRIIHGLLASLSRPY